MLHCPECCFSTSARHGTRPVESSRRHLDLGVWRLEIRARLRQLACPSHGVRTEGVPFARAGSRFTRDFEDLVGSLATTADKTTTCRLVRIGWDTVGRIIVRVMDDKLGPDRLEDLFEIGVDEVSWRRRHKYLTLVSNHQKNQVVPGKDGRDTATLDAFFDELGPERAGHIAAVSMDMSAGYAKSVCKDGHSPGALICYNPYHVVALATKAPDVVRRQHTLSAPVLSQDFSGISTDAPTVTWPTPADITYGTALGSAQLDASASVPGTCVEFEHEDHHIQRTVDATVWSHAVQIGKSTITTEVHVFGTGTETSIAIVTTDDVSLCSGLDFAARETIFERAIPPNDYHKEPVLDRHLGKGTTFQFLG
jgi:hypothetical protein